ncbi:hypothetical protein [Paraburkholderia rhizosphaerae]|uniref:hypothetical protein n=1 Tax=Paraburkholderia rhizosphaerae TaxID=480658 RepID=UPI0010662EAC|nr:hypothetical protein [Paraburkholderia rhizosphaerae]
MAPTQTLNHDLNNFVYVVGLCGNKTGRDLTDVFTVGYAAYWEHPSMPVVTESVFCEGRFNASLILFPCKIVRARRNSVHILFEHISQNLEAIDSGVLPGSEKPFLPLSGMRARRRLSRSARSYEEGIKR